MPRMVKQRDAFFDNAKYLAIVLVAVGHTWAQVMDHSRAVESAYRVVYTFHMPAFVLVSGYFSRGFDMRPDRLRRLVTGVALPYVVFETAYELFKDVADRPDTEISLLDPSYLMWFLAALFIWRLTTPLWKVMRHPLAVAVGVAALASLSPSIGQDFDLQRVLQFLPYFVLGLCLRPEHFQWVRRRSVRIAAVPLFAVAFAAAWWSVPRMNGGWFYRQSAAQDLGAPWWCGPVMTLAMMVCTLLLTAGFLAWVPGRRLWCTGLGAGTITGYLLHGFLVKFAVYRGWFDQDWVYRPLGVPALTVLAAAVVTALCTPPVRRALRCVTEPRMEWAFRPDPAAQARARERMPAAEPERVGT